MNITDAARSVAAGAGQGTIASGEGELRVRQFIDGTGHQDGLGTDAKIAEAEAESYWIKPANAIIEPTRQEIIEFFESFRAHM